MVTIHSFWSRRVALISGILVFGTLGFVAIKKVQTWTAFLGFRLETLTVRGHGRTPLPLLKKQLGLQRGDCIWKYSLKDLAENLRGLPWIKSVYLRRILPNTLWVTIQEKTPIAVWQYGGLRVLLDESGTAISRVDSKGFPELMVVTGEEAPLHVAELLKFLRQVEEAFKDKIFLTTVHGASFLRTKRWNLYLEDGKMLSLPENLSIEVFQRLHNHWNRLKHAVHIDLRFPQMILFQ